MHTDMNMTDKETPFLFVGNGPYANRGCEAITKSSVRLIREFYPGVPVINGNEGGEYDQADESEPDVVHGECKCFPGWYTRMWVSDIIYGKTRLLIDLSRAGEFVRTHAPSCRAVLSMGGDLYGLSHGRMCLIQYLFLGEAALKVKRPFVIWGATIGKIDSEPHLKRRCMEHFKRCTLILVRDRAGFDYLDQNGVRDNVRLVADPAFLLEPSEPRIPLPVKEPLEETIGFNLAGSYSYLGNLGSYRDMIKLGADCVEEIMRVTGRPVLLVPHIVAYPETHGDNDTLLLALIREVLAARGIEVAQLPSALRTWEIKWVLSRLRGYVGSRMHSTVSAMGSCTPTVSITFSEKGPALNELLLGHTRFTLNCRDLTPGNLCDKVTAILAEEQAVRDTLTHRIPEIKSMAHSAGQYLKDAIG